MHFNNLAWHGTARLDVLELQGWLVVDADLGGYLHCEVPERIGGVVVDFDWALDAVDGDGAPDQVGEFSEGVDASGVDADVLLRQHHGQPLDAGFHHLVGEVHLVAGVAEGLRHLCRRAVDDYP